MKKEKNEYMAPELTVVTFKAERGYAESETFFGLLLSFIDPTPTNGQEIWEIDNYSGSGWTND